MKYTKLFLKVGTKVLNGLLVVIIIIVMVFTLLNLKNVNNNEGTKIFGYSFYTVNSDSMKPKFQAGDLVITKEVNTDSLDKGDIITFHVGNGKILTHQIHEKTIVNQQNAFITKGINVDDVDQDPVYLNDVIGQYSFSIPKVGLLISFIKTVYGYIFLIAIPLLIIIGINSKKIIKVLKENKQEKLLKQTLKEQELQQERLKNKKMQEELAKLKEQLSVNNG